MASDSFSVEEKDLVVKAIQRAEKSTSGEIRVHIEKHCKEEVLDHAAFIFDRLKMNETQERNGVLIYLALKDHKFAIIGDAGIDEKVDDNFWDSTRDKMLEHFKKGDFVNGLSAGIEEAGRVLSQYFPYQSDDENELSDEISFGE